jgi:glycosyltransferase involved in cell wall biosynthesis
MHHIILFAFEFPPLMNGGVFRPLYFAKYLHQHGYRPVIITINKAQLEQRWPNSKFDHNLLNELKSSDYIIEEIEYDILLMHDSLLNPYQHSLDLRPVKVGFEKISRMVMDKYNPKAVMATSPPFSILKIALDFARKNSLPFIADLRDHWSLWCYRPYRSYFHYLNTLFTERQILKKSDLIITTSEVTTKDLVNWHKLNSEKVCTIHNGYDVPIKFTEKIGLLPKTKIRIVYVGSFYYVPSFQGFINNPWYKRISKGIKQDYLFQYVPRKEDWLYRSPYYFFKTISKLKTLMPDIKDKIEIVFAGKKDNWFDDMVAQFDLSDIIQHTGFLTHKESLELQQGADLLLITSAKIKDAQDYSIAGKTFEYFAMQKPILGFVCDGAQKNILEQSQMAIICNPDETEESAIKLKAIITNGITLSPNKGFIESFRRNNTTKLLADKLNNLLSI